MEFESNNFSLVLCPTMDQQAKIEEGVKRVLDATNRLSLLAWDDQVFQPSHLQKYYRLLRNEYGISAQHITLMLRRVSDGYKQKRMDCQVLEFRLGVGIPLDSKLFRIGANGDISINVGTIRIKGLLFKSSCDNRVLSNNKFEKSYLCKRNDQWVIHSLFNWDTIQN